MMRALIHAIAVLFTLGITTPAYALAIDISEEIIRVTTGFTGASLTVFGTHEKPGAVVIVVEGPPKTMTVRKKNRVLGLWTNTDSREFINVPAFYEVSATGPLDLIAPADIMAQRHIGIENVPLITKENNRHTPDFAAALVQMQEDRKLFVRAPGTLSYPGPMLFKTHFTMPAIVPQGSYKVSAYLFENGRVIEEDSITFRVVPEGTSADLRRFATQDGLLYGLTCMLMAIVAGWLATVLLKRD